MGQEQLRSDYICYSQASRPDADQIVTLFYDTVHSVNARDYTPKQFDAWAPKRSADKRKKLAERLNLSLRKHISSGRAELAGG
jgi:hypothetical protein